MVSILKGIPHGGIKEREQLWFQTVIPKQKSGRDFLCFAFCTRMVSCPRGVGLGGHSTVGTLPDAGGPALPPAEVVLLLTRGEIKL